MRPWKDYLSSQILIFLVYKMAKLLPSSWGCEDYLRYIEIMPRTSHVEFQHLWYIWIWLWYLLYFLRLCFLSFSMACNFFHGSQAWIYQVKGSVVNRLWVVWLWGMERKSGCLWPYDWVSVFQLWTSHLLLSTRLNPQILDETEWLEWAGVEHFLSPRTVRSQ